MVFILVTLFIDILGIGIIIPILPELIKELLGNDAQAAVYYGVIISTYATMQFLCAPVLGALTIEADIADARICMRRGRLARATYGRPFLPIVAYRLSRPKQ